MGEETMIKCRYFNTGHCKFSVKENGCKHIHPGKTCSISNCKNFSCPDRHPRLCRYQNECRFQKRCSYKHIAEKDSATSTEGEIVRLKKICESLEVEILKLKADNNEKINNLVKVHLTELEQLRKENLDIKQSLHACQELCDATLTKKDDEIKQAHSISKNKLDQNDEKINTLAKVHMSEIEKLKSENDDLTLKFTDTLASKDLIIHENFRIQEEDKKEHIKVKEQYDSYKYSINVTLAGKDREIKILQASFKELENTIKTLDTNFTIKTIEGTKEKNSVNENKSIEETDTAFKAASFSRYQKFLERKAMLS